MFEKPLANFKENNGNLKIWGNFCTIKCKQNNIFKTVCIIE